MIVRYVALGHGGELNLLLEDIQNLKRLSETTTEIATDISILDTEEARIVLSYRHKGMMRAVEMPGEIYTEPEDYTMPKISNSSVDLITKTAKVGDIVSLYVKKTEAENVIIYRTMITIHRLNREGRSVVAHWFDEHMIVYRV